MQDGFKKKKRQTAYSYSAIYRLKDIIAAKIRVCFDMGNFQKNLGEDGLKPKIGQTGEGDAEKWVRPPSGRKRDGRFDIPERMLYLCATFVLYELKLSL